MEGCMKQSGTAASLLRVAARIRGAYLTAHAEANAFSQGNMLARQF